MWKLLVKIGSKLKNASYYSFNGLKTTFQSEFSFRLEVITLIIALPAAMFLGNSALERVVLISSLFLVLLSELLNSAIEITLNRIDRHWHPLTKKAKDIGSAAVLVSIINAIIVWLMIIISRT